MRSYIKIFFIFNFVFAVHSSNANQLNDKFNSIKVSTFGVEAKKVELDGLEKILPDIKLSKTGKSLLTVNKMGYDILNGETESNWLISDFTQLVKSEQGKTILDIGSGYGRISHIALKQNHNVISNDIAAEHLLHNRKIAKSNGLSIENLYLNNNHFPDKLSMPNNSLDAVVLYRVVVFLSPDEMEEGISNVHKWLKKGGKFYIVSLSPFHNDYSEWFLPIYNAKWESGDKWPGVNLEVEKALPKQAYNLPKYLHIMDERPLEYALKNAGFEIEKKEFIDMTRFGSKNDKIKRDGKESFGIIAVKK
jgi:SAM-dependent methyltransferase